MYVKKAEVQVAPKGGSRMNNRITRNEVKGKEITDFEKRGEQ